MALDTRCRECGADLHSCTNCRHFDTSAPNECRQPVERAVLKKAKANDCPAFEPKIVREQSARRDAPKEGKAAFDALFDL